MKWLTPRETLQLPFDNRLSLNILFYLDMFRQLTLAKPSGFLWSNTLFSQDIFRKMIWTLLFVQICTFFCGTQRFSVLFLGQSPVTPSVSWLEYIRFCNIITFLLATSEVSELPAIKSAKVLVSMCDFRTESLFYPHHLAPVPLPFPLSHLSFIIHTPTPQHPPSNTLCNCHFITQDASASHFLLVVVVKTQSKIPWNLCFSLHTDQPPNL